MWILQVVYGSIQDLLSIICAILINFYQSSYNSLVEQLSKQYSFCFLRNYRKIERKEGWRKCDMLCKKIHIFRFIVKHNNLLCIKFYSRNYLFLKIWTQSICSYLVSYIIRISKYINNIIPMYICKYIQYHRFHSYNIIFAV